MRLPRFTFGIGDRFACSGRAQLRAFPRIDGIAPVWNKSWREHRLIGSEPATVRAAAAAAVAAEGWTGPWFVDADHVGAEALPRFAPHCDFFTLDVAEAMGRRAGPEAVAAFLDRHGDLATTVGWPGMERTLTITRDELAAAAARVLDAAMQAVTLHRQLEALRPDGAYAVEVSLDETDEVQGPAEIVAVLAVLADAGISADTIAPRFPGRFNKGVDYVGDVTAFAQSFAADAAAAAWASTRLGMRNQTRLSVHSGSDKFAIYPAIRAAVTRLGTGLHLKTAGTTWLAEVEGLALAGREGLELAQRIYAGAYAGLAEMVAPYAPVVDISVARLPAPALVANWDGRRFAAALHHDAACPEFNRDFRQLIHVGFPVAARLGGAFTAARRRCADIIDPVVTDNLSARHLRQLLPETCAHAGAA
jgi:hypothetical protein